MNRRIQEIFTIAEGRYLTKEESDHISQHAASVAARLQAMQEVSEKESAIVEGTMREVLRAYPDLEQKYRAARPKGTRDIALALRFATSAMVRNDPDALQAELLSWFNTILKGLGLAASRAVSARQRNAAVQAVIAIEVAVADARGRVTHP